MESESYDLLNLIKKRRSIRVFNGEKIPEQEIISIIEAGIWAPTGCNNQELRFAILSSNEELKEILKFKPHLKGLSHFILVFCDMSLPSSQKWYKWKGRKMMPYMDAGAALMNMALFAKSRNIDSCICNLSDYHLGKQSRGNESFIRRIAKKVMLKLNLFSFHEDSFVFYLRKRLKIPSYLKIMGGIALGYAKKYPDVEREWHGGKRVMREDVKFYILPKYWEGKNKDE